MTQILPTNTAWLSSRYQYEVPYQNRSEKPLPFPCVIVSQKKCFSFVFCKEMTRSTCTSSTLPTLREKNNSVYTEKQCQIPRTAECFTAHNSPLKNKYKVFEGDASSVI